MTAPNFGAYKPDFSQPNGMGICVPIEHRNSRVSTNGFFGQYSSISTSLAGDRYDGDNERVDGRKEIDGHWKKNKMDDER